MNLPVWGNASMVAGAKLLLAAVSPLQGLLDKPGAAHEFCNRQAVKLLKNAGYTGYAQFISDYMLELNAGVYWADTGWKNVCHYYNPVNGRGLWQFNHAIEVFGSYYSRSLQYAADGQLRKAVFFLGAAAHLLQDLCVPHHARAKVFNGHKEYEGWVKDNYARYAVDSAADAYYQGNIDKVLRGNAAMAADLYDQVNLERGGVSYPEVTLLTLPQAQRTTAGLLQQFCAAARQSIEMRFFTVA